MAVAINSALEIQEFYQSNPGSLLYGNPYIHVGIPNASMAFTSSLAEKARPAAVKTATFTSELSFTRCKNSSRASYKPSPKAFKWLLPIFSGWLTPFNHNRKADSNAARGSRHVAELRSGHRFVSRPIPNKQSQRSRIRVTDRLDDLMSHPALTSIGASLIMRNQREQVNPAREPRVRVSRSP